jgi:hypothetical protein
MSDAGENEKLTAQTGAAIAAAIRRAEIALDNIKRSLKEDDLADLGAKVAAAASTLFNEGEALIAQSDALQRAKAEVGGAVRRNPLAALGIAFGAGLLIALLTKG